MCSYHFLSIVYEVSLTLLSSNTSYSILKKLEKCTQEIDKIILPMQTYLINSSIIAGKIIDSKKILKFCLTTSCLQLLLIFIMLLLHIILCYIAQ